MWMCASLPTHRLHQIGKHVMIGVLVLIPAPLPLGKGLLSVLHVTRRRFCKEGVDCCVCMFNLFPEWQVDEGCFKCHSRHRLV
jgi:hypothetical protein